MIVDENCTPTFPRALGLPTNLACKSDLLAAAAGTAVFSSGAKPRRGNMCVTSRESVMSKITYEASREYGHLMQSALGAYHEALDRDEDFDFVIEPGRKIEGYREVVKTSAQ